MGRVLDDGNPVGKTGAQGCDIRGQTSEMHRHNGLCAWGEGGGNGIGGDAEGVRVDIAEDRPGSAVECRVSSAAPSEARHDNVVARTDTVDQQCEVQSGSAGVDGDDVGSPDVGREFLLEGDDFGTHPDPART